MKKKILFFVTIFITAFAFGQEFKGQWKGEFIDKSTSMVNWGGDKCDYVLEIETKGKSVSGYSYTYFTDGGKKFYTICRLEGFIDKRNKYIEVKEVERTKTNVPNNIRNCFQTHKLTYFKQGDTETLEGNWIPAPKQQGDCGYGYTNLSRRMLISNIPRISNPVVKKAPQKSTTGSFKETVKTKPAIKTEPPKSDFVLQSKKAFIPKENKEGTEDKIISGKIISAPSDFTKRNRSVLRTIEVSNEMITVDLYDNGEIDGDSISLYYNGKLLIAKKMLTTKPIRLTLEVDKDTNSNELVMFAENLGSIPPNTALMVVSDGGKRYEVRITSDLQKSGTIQFIHESKGKAAVN